MKRKPVIKMKSFGKYSEWNRNSRDIPKILEFTTDIKAEAGTEFGYVLHIKNGKGEKLTFEIKHPPFTDEKGKVRPPFTGEQFITTNDFEFYLGDYIWEPVTDKVGIWELTTFYNNKVVANKKFIIS